jgi:hypothetical protein
MLRWRDTLSEGPGSVPRALSIGGSRSHDSLRFLAIHLNMGPDISPDPQRDAPATSCGP